LPRNAGLTLLRLLLHGAGLPAAPILRALARTFAMQFVIGRTGIRVSERPLLERSLSLQEPAVAESPAGEPVWLITSVLTIAELNIHLNGWFDIPAIQAAAGAHVEVRKAERGVIFKFAGEGVDFAFQARRLRSIDGKFRVTEEIYRSAELFQAIDMPQTLDAIRGDIVPRSAQRDEVAVYGTSSPTILLVDKEDFTRHLCTSILRDCGYRVIEASSGLDAIHLAQRHQSIDVLLTDMTMPYFSGADLAHTITGIHPDIRVLFMSGKGGYSPGPGKVVQKPFTREALTRQIRDLLKY
jgi:CheY-like chemotaxis protein